MRIGIGRDAADSAFASYFGQLERPCGKLVTGGAASMVGLVQRLDGRRR
jgi:hypothetical protein